MGAGVERTELIGRTEPIGALSAAPRPKEYIMSEFGSMQPPKKRSVGRMIVSILILAVSLSFIFSNWESVPLKFLWLSTPSLPMWLWLLITFVAGVLLGGVVRGGIRKMRNKGKVEKK
jgi:uncharacterized integral membrane protein